MAPRLVGPAGGGGGVVLPGSMIRPTRPINQAGDLSVQSGTAADLAVSNLLDVCPRIRWLLVCP